MGQELWGLLSRRPGATSQRRNAMSDGQIHPLKKPRQDLGNNYVQNHLQQNLV
jgi:hypothetical protein